MLASLGAAVRDTLMGKRQDLSDGSKSGGGGMCSCFTLAFYKPVRVTCRIHTTTW